MTRSGIYQITNEIDSTVYIGSTTDLKYRRWCHFDYDLTYLSNKHLRRAMDKHGKENFTFTVLEYVEDVTQLISREQFYIDKAISESKKLYNVSLTAGSTIGIPRPEEVRKKISVSLTGHVVTESTRNKIREAWTQEKRKLYSELHRAIKLQPEARKRNSESKLGKRHSEERRRANSEGQKRYQQKKRCQNVFQLANSF